MKIKKLAAENFGCLKNWESPLINKNIVLFIGSNESGKSTIFNLVSSLFYGFSPVSKEDNPYSPWDGTNASCSGEIVYDDGTEIIINRTLKSRADGVLTCKSNSTDIGNNPIIGLDKLPRNIFMEAYALTVDELCFPDDKLWQKMQDQLLGGQYKSFLMPVRDVISGIESESVNLWRPDRRGAPMDKRLRSSLTELKERLKCASENEKRLHDLQKELSNLNILLNNKLAEKTRLTAYIEKFQRLSPVRKKLIAIEEMKVKCQWISLLKDIPENAGKVLAELDKKIEHIESVQQGLYEDQKKYEYQAGLFTQKDRKICGNTSRIKDAVRSYGQISMDLQSESDADEEIKNIRGRLFERAEDFIKGGWKDDYENTINNVDEAGLRISIDKFNRLKSEGEGQKVRMEGLRSKPESRLSLVLMSISLLLIISGSVAMVLSGPGSKGLFYIPSIAAGIILSVYCLTLRKNKDNPEIREANRHLRDIEDKKGLALQSIKKCLGTLPVSEVILENPDEGLLISISRLKDTIRVLKDVLDSKNRIENRLLGETDNISQLMLSLNEIPGDNVLKSISCLEDLLNASLENKNTYVKSAEKLEEIKELLSEKNEERKKIEIEKESLVNEISKIDGKTIEDRLNTLIEMRKIQESAAVLEDELKREYPDLTDIEQEIKDAEKRNESWTSSDEKMASALTQKEQLEVELNRINERIGSVKEGLEQKESFDRLDDLKGEAMALEEEIKKGRVKRDTLQLLKNILIEADRQYREENQPDILKKAGRYLNIITGGRYLSLMMDDSGKGLVVREGNGKVIELDRALSRGTKEQIYLSLRLALVEHLDIDGEHIPLFLDEAFVNWDSLRSDNFIKILKDIAELRQVFIFTCHSTFAERFKHLPNVNIVNL